MWCGARNGRCATSPAPSCSAGHGLDARHVDRLGRRQRRQDRREAPREHRLAGAGRPVHVDVVAAGGGDLQRRDQRVLAADVGEVEHRLGLAAPRSAAGRWRAARRGPPARRRSRCSDSMPSTCDARHERGLRAARARQQQAAASWWRRTPSAIASAPRIERTSPVSDSSPTTAHSSTAAGVQLLGGDEDRDRERQVEPRADLAQVRGRQVDRDPHAAGTRGRSW